MRSLNRLQTFPHSHTEVRFIEKGQFFARVAQEIPNPFRIETIRNERAAPGAYLTVRIGTISICEKKSLARTFDWEVSLIFDALPLTFYLAFTSLDFSGPAEVTFVGVKKSP